MRNRRDRQLDRQKLEQKERFKEKIAINAIDVVPMKENWWILHNDLWDLHVNLYQSSIYMPDWYRLNFCFCNY